MTLRKVDVTDQASVEAALTEDVEAFGRIDAFVNNAGVLGEVVPLWETSPANFRHVLDVNLVGAYLCLRAVLGVMHRQEARPLRGHVINVASVQGKEGMALASAYAASKAGLIALTKSAGKEAGPLGIMVNCVTPAAAETAMAKQLTPARRADILQRIPLGRFVDVDEIARWSCSCAPRLLIFDGRSVRPVRRDDDLLIVDGRKRPGLRVIISTQVSHVQFGHSIARESWLRWATPRPCRVWRSKQERV